MSDADRAIATAAEMADLLPETAAGNVDWPEALDRIEKWSGVDLGSDLDGPLIRKIKAAVREARRTT